METRFYNVYKFNELNAESRAKALARNGDINCDNWSESVLEDAKRIGLKIKTFDMDIACFVRDIEGEILTSAPEVAEAIMRGHGEQCATYKAAKAYQADKPLDRELADELFKDTLLNCYRAMLQKEFEYQSSEARVIETLLCNDYDFTIDGEIAPEEPASPMRYYLGNLYERSGKHEYCTSVRFKCEGDPDEGLNAIASRWYGGDSEEADGEHYFEGGSMVVRAAGTQEIPEAVFNSIVLITYMAKEIAVRAAGAQEIPKAVFDAIVLITCMVKED